MKRLPATFAATFTAVVLLGGIASGAHAARSFAEDGTSVPKVKSAANNRQTYIVRLAAEPAASYDGGISGYTATRPAPGVRFNNRSAASRQYLRYLRMQQDTATALVSGAQIIARYNTVYNGFAARLTDVEAAALRASPMVIDVQADVARKLETISTPTFLGLTSPGGVWSQMVNGTAVKGEDIVIGVIDGGVWPESTSYADRIDGAGKPVFNGGTQAYGPAPASWTGTCAPGQGFVPAQHCNNKLIGAQFFNAGFQAFVSQNPGNPQHWSDFTSPRDSVAGPTAHGGHGSHTSSTSAGNTGPLAIISGTNFGPASGIAPRARIAAYKICWTYVDLAATDGTGTSNSCFNSDAVAAIDKAVSDGVHVINYSVSGSQTSVNDAVEQAFLRAANAGVFVAASAGNSGPGNAVAHVSPWLTTVAASTHDRSLSANVTLGNGAVYTGASVNTSPLPLTAMIRAEDAGVAGAPADLNLCILSPLALDPAKVTGKVVVCTRGTNARIEKSAAVAAAGGVGMVLVDTGAGLVAEAHSVPTVHVNAADGALIKTYAAVSGATASIGTFYNSHKPAPIMANFSSRGPNQGDPNMLKPDLTAPGVDVIATVSPVLNQAERDAVVAGTLVPPPDWASYQGTSMSSPHVAGLAALLRQAHPTWSPAAIKSALMTSGYSTLDDGQPGLANGLLPWAQGGGHVQPNKAIDPGLVYDLDRIDYIRYQCKVNRAAVSPASDCTTYGALDQTYNLNLPSITLGAVPTSATITRRLTNVGMASASYSSTAVVPGFDVVVTPATLTLTPGETKSFTLKLTATSAITGNWNYGSLTWTDGSHVIKSPVTARAGSSIVAAGQVAGTTVSGSSLLTISTGISGRLSANKGGLKPVTLGSMASLTPSPLTQAQVKAICVAGLDTPAVKVYPFAIAADTIVARFGLRDADVGTPGDDNDIMLLSPAGVDTYSGNEGSGEQVQAVAPSAGNWKVCVVAWGGASAMTHKLSSWVITTADASANMNVLLPGAVYADSTATVGLAWRGLDVNQRYLGGFQLKDSANAVQSTTVVEVNTTSPAPAAQPRAVSTEMLRE